MIIFSDVTFILSFSNVPLRFWSLAVNNHVSVVKEQVRPSLAFKYLRTVLWISRRIVLEPK